MESTEIEVDKAPLVDYEAENVDEPELEEVGKCMRRLDTIVEPLALSARCFVTLVNIVVCILGCLLFLVGLLLSVSVTARMITCYIEEEIPALKTLGPTISAIIQDSDNSELDLPGVFKFVADILIPPAIAIVLLSALGVTVGRWTCPCLLHMYVYVYVLIILVVVEILVVFFFLNGAADHKLKSMLIDMLVVPYAGVADLKNVYSLLFTILMKAAACCGVEGYLDFHYKAHNWRSSFPFDAGGFTLNLTLQAPVMCCKLGEGFEVDIPNSIECLLEPTDINSNRNVGCWQRIVDWRSEQESSFIMVTVIVCILEALLGGCTMLIILGNRWRRMNRRRKKKEKSREEDVEVGIQEYELEEGKKEEKGHEQGQEDKNDTAHGLTKRIETDVLEEDLTNDKSKESKGGKGDLIQQKKEDEYGEKSLESKTNDKDEETDLLEEDLTNDKSKESKGGKGDLIQQKKEDEYGEKSLESKKNDEDEETDFLEEDLTIHKSKESKGGKGDLIQQKKEDEYGEKSLESKKNDKDEETDLLEEDLTIDKGMESKGGKGDLIQQKKEDEYGEKSLESKGSENDEELNQEDADSAQKKSNNEEDEWKREDVFTSYVEIRDCVKEQKERGSIDMDGMLVSTDGMNVSSSPLPTLRPRHISHSKASCGMEDGERGEDMHLKPKSYNCTDESKAMEQEGENNGEREKRDKKEMNIKSVHINEMDVYPSKLPPVNLPYEGLGCNSTDGRHDGEIRVRLITPVPYEDTEQNKETKQTDNESVDRKYDKEEEGWESAEMVRNGRIKGREVCGRDHEEGERPTKEARETMHGMNAFPSPQPGLTSLDVPHKEFSSDSMDEMYDEGIGDRYMAPASCIGSENLGDWNYEFDWTDDDEDPGLAESVV